MPTLLTVPEAAEALRVSVETVYKYTRSGHLPSVRYTSGASRVLIPAEAVAAFVAAHTRGGPAASS